MEYGLMIVGTVVNDLSLLQIDVIKTASIQEADSGIASLIDMSRHEGGGDPLDNLSENTTSTIKSNPIRSITSSLSNDSD